MAGGGRTQVRTQGKARRQGASRRSPAGGGESRGRLLRWYGGGVVTGVLASFLVYLATLPGGPAAEASPCSDNRSSNNKTNNGTSANNYNNDEHNKHRAKTLKQNHNK